MSQGLPSHTLAGATQDSDIRKMNRGNNLHALLFTVLTVNRLSPDGTGTTVPITWLEPFNYQNARDSEPVSKASLSHT